MFKQPYATSVKDEQAIGDRIVQILERAEFSPKRCLDVGCGRGYLLQQLQIYNFCQILGLEYDAETPKIEEFVVDREAVTGEFDLITCIHALARMEDPADALRWMTTKLSPGGTILLEQAIGNGYTRTSLEEMLHQLGLSYMYIDLEVGADIFIGEQYKDAVMQKVYYSFDSPDMQSKELYMNWLSKQYGRTA
jgi:2-polyprenyl-3-methyl-5-hydroxy-6-metoxy-1,4-benzoquinol methylase